MQVSRNGGMEAFIVSLEDFEPVVRIFTSSFPLLDLNSALTGERGRGLGARLHRPAQPDAGPERGRRWRGAAARLLPPGAGVVAQADRYQRARGHCETHRRFGAVRR